MQLGSALAAFAFYLILTGIISDLRSIRVSVYIDIVSGLILPCLLCVHYIKWQEWYHRTNLAYYYGEDFQ